MRLACVGGKKCRLSEFGMNRNRVKDIILCSQVTEDAANSSTCTTRISHANDKESVFPDRCVFIPNKRHINPKTMTLEQSSQKCKYRIDQIRNCFDSHLTALDVRLWY